MKTISPKRPFVADDVFTSPRTSTSNVQARNDGALRTESMARTLPHSTRAVDSSVFEPGMRYTDALPEIAEDDISDRMSQISLRGPPSPGKRPHANTIPSPSRGSRGRPSVAALLAYGRPAQANDSGGLGRSMVSGAEDMLRSYSTPVPALRDLTNCREGPASWRKNFVMEREMNVPNVTGSGLPRIGARWSGPRTFEPAIIEEEVSREPWHYDTSDIEGTDTEISHHDLKSKSSLLGRAQMETASDGFAVDPDQTPRATPLGENNVESNPFFANTGSNISDNSAYLASAIRNNSSMFGPLDGSSQHIMGTPDLVADLHRKSCLSSHGGHSRESSWSSDISTLSGPSSPQRVQFVNNTSLLPHKNDLSPIRATRQRPQFNRCNTSFT